MTHTFKMNKDSLTKPYHERKGGHENSLHASTVTWIPSPKINIEAPHLCFRLLLLFILPPIGEPLAPSIIILQQLFHGKYFISLLPPKEKSNVCTPLSATRLSKG